MRPLQGQRAVAQCDDNHTGGVRFVLPAGTQRFQPRSEEDRYFQREGSWGFKAVLGFARF